MMAEEGADPTGLAPAADSYRNEGATVMFLAVDGVLAGLIAVADSIKPTTADSIRRLHGEGLRVIILTGDNRRTGEAVAARLGIAQVIVDALSPAKDVTISPLKTETGSAQGWERLCMLWFIAVGL